MNISDNIHNEFNAVPVPAAPLDPSVYRACASRSRPNKGARRAKTLIAACLIIITTIGAAFAFSEDFRALVISFFKSGQVEAPVSAPPISGPSDNIVEGHLPQGIRYLGTQEIAGIADISYYQSENRFEMYDNTFAVRTEDDKLKIYKLDGEDFAELPQYRVEDVLHIWGLDIPLSFVYVFDNGMIKTFDNVYDPESGGQATAVWSVGGDCVWVDIGIRYELSTYLLYNLRTGETRDIIGDAGIELTPDTQIYLSPDEKSILVNDLHRPYLIDAETGAAYELSALYSPSDEIYASFIDSETLSVWQCHESGEVLYSIYSYDISGSEKTLVCNSVPYSSNHPGTETGVRGLGKGITIMVETEQYVLIDEKSGARYPIEGIKPDSGISFLLSPDRSKVLVTTISGQNGLGITQIGYINLEKRELKVFERKDFTNYETSMYWVNGNEFAVRAEGENEYLYVYSFK